ncbi:MAG: 50S ribosomal protein L15 [Deltaproteobacteria bacterium]|nr:MAG: 50S ribosomal protein L15 [Deltaproteobacteria bacterium]
MGTTLSTLSPAPGATRRKKRVGRGRGSHRGKTSTRGQKGQKSRSGSHMPRPGFEGGQMPMARRLPKRGFKNVFRKEVAAINVGLLASRFSGEVDVDALRAAGLIPKRAELVKVLAEGEIDKPLVVRAHRFSKSAIAKIEAAGGKAEVVASQNGGSDAVESA